MSTTLSMDCLAFDEVDATQARTILWKALNDALEREKAYVSLSRWTWRILVERRLDVDLRDWHRLILDFAGTLSRRESGTCARSRGERHAPLEPKAIGERLKAFADLVAEQIRAAEAARPEELTRRAHVAEVLSALAGAPGEHLEREAIKEKSGLKDANLSRLLTLLAANGLVERHARGRNASFRITQRGLAATRHRQEVDVSAARPPVTIRLAPPSVEPEPEDQWKPDVRIRVKVHGRSNSRETPPSMPSLKLRNSEFSKPASIHKEAEILQYA